MVVPLHAAVVVAALPRAAVRNDVCDPVTNMCKQNLFFRALRCATIAFCVAAGLEGLRQIAVSGLSPRLSQMVAPLVCAALVFLLTFELLWRGQVSAGLLKAQTNASEDVQKMAGEGLQRLGALGGF